MPLRAFIPALLALLLAGCGEANKPAAPVAGAETRFAMKIGAETLRMRVMLTELELETGLMETPSLPPDEGMLFAYRDSGRRAFWMKNVPYDIDIGFFDTAGALTQVELLRANDLTPVETRSDRIRYAVEAPAGWYAAHAVKPGSKLDLSAVAESVGKRGFDTKAFVGEK